MRVHWTNNAIEHLPNIYEYIGLNSPTYAKKMVDRIIVLARKSREYRYRGCRRQRTRCTPQ